MPIQLLAGPPRSGKSHYGTKYRLMSFIKKGVRTITDIAGLDVDAVAAYTGLPADRVRELVVHVTPEEVTRLLKAQQFLYHPDKCPNSTVRPGDHLMLDEAWRYWPAGQALNEIEQEFFPYHGHYNDPVTGNAIEITLLTQDKSQLAKGLHPLIEARYVFRKMKVTGRPDKFQVWIYDGNNRKATTHYEEKYDPAIFPLYKSANSGDARDDFDARRSIYNARLLRFIRYGAPALVLLGIVGAAWSLHRFVSPKNEPAPLPAAAASSSVPASVPPAPAFASQMSQGSKGISADWRLLGSYRVQGGYPVVVVQDGNGRIRSLTPGRVDLTPNGEIIAFVDGREVTSWSTPAPTYTEPDKGKK